MKNPLIKLTDQDTNIDKCKKLVEDQSRVIFLILGGTPSYDQVAKDAEDLTDTGIGSKSWRYAVQVIPVDNSFYAYLKSLPTDNLTLPGAYTPSDIYGISISTNGTICDIVTGTAPGLISMAYSLAETY